MSGNSLLARSIFSNYVGTFSRLAITFFLSPFLVQTLGDTQYGIWSILSALTGYILILDLGIGSAIVRYVARYRALNDNNSLNELISSAFAVYIIIAAIIVLITPLLAWSIVTFIEFDENLNDTVYLLVVITSLNLSLAVFKGLFRGTLLGFQRYDICNALAIGFSIYSALAMVMVLKMGYGLVGMSLVVVTANILAITIYMFLVRMYFSDIRIDLRLARFTTAKTAVNFGKYSFLSMVANQLVYYSDAIIVGSLISAAAVTYYTIAVTLANHTHKLVTSISSSFVPFFTGKQTTETEDQLANSYLVGTKIVIAVSNLFCIGLFVLGSAFIELWMGKKYADVCTPLLILLICAQYFKGPQHLSYALLQSMGKHKVYALLQFVFSLLNLVLSIILIYPFGLIGVAIGTAISQIMFHGLVVPYITLPLVKVNSAVFIRKTFLASLGPSLALAAILYGFTQWNHPDSYSLLLAQAAIGTTFYLLLFYAFVLETSEKEMVSKVLKRAFGRSRFLRER